MHGRTSVVRSRPVRWLPCTWRAAAVSQPCHGLVGRGRTHASGVDVMGALSCGDRALLDCAALAGRLLSHWGSRGRGFKSRRPDRFSNTWTLKWEQGGNDHDAAVWRTGSEVLHLGQASIASGLVCVESAVDTGERWCRLGGCEPLRKLALGAAVVLGVAACVVLVLILAGRGPRQPDLWVAVLAALAGVVAAIAAVWPLLARHPLELPPYEAVPEWVVDRPAEPQRAGDPRAGECGRPGDAGRRPKPQHCPPPAADHHTILRRLVHPLRARDHTEISPSRLAGGTDAGDRLPPQEGADWEQSGNH